MTQTITPQAVSQLLNDDIAACTKLLELLGQEQDALKNRDIEALESLVENKSQQLIHLEKSAGVRTSWARSASSSADQGWQELINGFQDKHVLALWKTLKEQLAECKVKNEVNGKMLARNQQIYGRLFDVVRGQNSANKLYSATGESTSGGRSQIVGEA